MFMLDDFPALAAGFLDELVGFRGVGGFHVGAVPDEGLAGAEGDVSEEDDFGEFGGVFEVSAGGSAAFAGDEPIGVVAFGAGEGLSGAFVFAVQGEGKEAGHAGPAAAGDAAFFADEEDAVAAVADALFGVIGVDAIGGSRA